MGVDVSEVSVPFTYRFPPGLIVIVLIVVGGREVAKATRNSFVIGCPCGRDYGPLRLGKEALAGSVGGAVSGRLSKIGRDHN